MQVRVGNTDAKGKPNNKVLTINNVCTKYGATPSKTLTVVLTCDDGPISGRYVTLQVTKRNHMQLTEIAFAIETPGAVISTSGGDSAPEGPRTYLPSLCQDNGDPYCDPNWTPFANMNMALMGYDIVESDPLAKGGDKGFRSQIFGAVVTDDAGRMVLSDGIAAVDMLECQSNFDSKTVSTLSVGKKYFISVT